MSKEVDEYRDGDMGMGMGGGGGGWRDSLRNLRTFSSMKNPVFRLYYAAMLGQMAGMNMQMFARSYLLKRLTSSPTIVGAMAFANAIPMLTLSLFGGVIADRVQKKYVLLIGQAGSAVISLGVALTLTLGYLSLDRTFTILGMEIPSWSILVVSSVFQGVIMALMMPSRQAIIREIVSEEQLLNAVSLNNMGMNALRIFAPAATGWLIKAVDFQGVYYAATGMYVVAVVFIALLPLTSTITIRGGSALTDLKEGFSYLRHESTILIILVFLLLAIVLSMPYGLLMPFFCDDILKVDEAGCGVLVGVSGIGAVAGSLVLASLPNKKRGLILLASSLLMGVSLVGFALSSSWYLSMGVIVFIGLGQTGQMTMGGTLIQYYTDPEYLGRVMGILMMQFGLMSFGTFGAGLLAEAIGVQWALGGFAMVLAFLSVLALVFFRRIRKLD